MNKIECANCGKLIYQGAKSCPFCGIKYVDMTHIDLDDIAKFVLMLKIGTPKGKAILTQIATPHLDNSSFCLKDEEWRDVYRAEDLVCYKLNCPKVLHTNLAFTSANREGQPVFTLQLIGDDKSECHRLCDQSELRYQQ